MARRRGGSDITVDIFNFLGVVKNLLGVLMVIIIGLAVGASESSGSAGSDSGGDEATTQEATETQPASPKPPMPEIPAGWEGKEGRELVEMIAQAIVVQKLVKASADHPDPAGELKSLLGEISELTVKLKLLQEQAKEKDISPVVPSKYELAPGKPQDSSSVSRFHPAYVECTDYALLVHPLASATGAGGVSSRNLVFAEGDLQRIRRADINGPRFRRFLESLKENGANGVLFLIRPDGVLTFRLAEAICEELKIRSERLAIPGFEPLDLGMFGAAGR